MDAHPPMAAHNNNNPFPHTMPLSVYALEGEWVDRFPEPPVIPPFTPSCINTPKSTNTATNMKKKILNKPVAKKHVEFVCADETNLSTAENSGDEGNKHDDDDFDYDEFDQTYNCTNYVSASYTTGTTAPLIEYAYTMPVHQTPMPYQFPAANSPFPPLLDTPHTYEFPHFTGALPPPPPMYTNTNTNMQFMAHTLTPRPPPPPPPPPMDDTDTVVQTAHPYEVVHQCVPMVPKVEEIADNEYAEGEGEGQGEDHNNGSDGSDGSGGLQEDTESKEEGSNN
uniref:Uncharacterized protein n=1 Tax=Vitrella brassicaformis TaxID=1169539 RepID=A0A7S1KDP8_9ALVE|mmetsp:Transcript_49380/g.123807  ORF Transcript_49380/g.123807 Transcript_49380/m.123807 type:complete len:281 (+) Transcript_49380:2-844(+)